MNRTDARRPARTLVVLSCVLFFVFIGLALYHKLLPHVDSDRSLLDELQSATIVDDELPASETKSWPQWRGIRRDGVAFEPRLLTRWPQDGPKELWQVPGGAGHSSFAVRDGLCYTMVLRDGRETVLCLHTDGGKEKWHFDYEVRYPPAGGGPPPAGGSGPRSTPTLDGDHLYVVGVAGQFHCLDAQTGKPLWPQRHDLAEEFNAPIPKWGVSFSPLVEGKFVVTTPGGPNGNAIVAFDKETGAVAWHCLDDRAGYSSPIALTAGGVRQIVAFLANGVVGVGADDGSLLWSYPWTTFAEVNAATPVAFKAKHGDRELDYVFISSGYGKGCALLKITPTDGGGFGAQRVYMGNQLCSHFATPVRRGDYLYGFNEAKLVCMDIKTGKIKWSQGGFNKGSLLAVGDHLVILGEKGQLALFEATPKAPKQIAQANPFPGRPPQTWTMPVLAEGKLFLRDEEVILCLESAEK
jgi:outer membrane protein assembly factor BamB